MRLAGARRDVSRICKTSNPAGASQRRLVVATGQAQGEVSDVLRRARVVSNLYVLARTADGLGTRRGWWGLAYDRGVACITGLASGRTETAVGG
jgi:hypothetical protein